MSLLTSWTRRRLSPLVRLLALWRRPTAVAAKADDLIAVYGEFAYSEARSIARLERAGKHPREYRFWSQVALEIARRQGREIGVTGADRWLREAHADHTHQRHRNGASGTPTGNGSRDG